MKPPPSSLSSQCVDSTVEPEHSAASECIRFSFCQGRKFINEKNEDEAQVFNVRAQHPFSFRRLRQSLLKPELLAPTRQSKPSFGIA